MPKNLRFLAEKLVNKLTETTCTGSIAPVMVGGANVVRNSFKKKRLVTRKLKEKE